MDYYVLGAHRSPDNARGLLCSLCHRFYRLRIRQFAGGVRRAHFEEHADRYELLHRESSGFRSPRLLHVSARQTRRR